MAKPVSRGTVCECGEDNWFDNRAKKKSGEYKPNAADFKCANKECGKGVWLTPMKKTYKKPTNTTEKVQHHEEGLAREERVKLAILMAEKKIDSQILAENYKAINDIIRDEGIINEALDEVSDKLEDVSWGDETAT